MRLPSISELDERVSRGLIKRVMSPCGRLVLYTYTPKCQFDGAWDEVTRQARGLVFEAASGRCVARPFPKFFNHTEPQAVDEMPPGAPTFVQTKYDGSLGIGFVYDHRVWWATRGSFTSEQSQAAASLWGSRSRGWMEGLTVLVEIIHPSSRVVVDYKHDALVLLAVVETETGHEWGASQCEEFAETFGLTMTTTYHGPESYCVQWAEDYANKQTDQLEGFVLGWRQNGRVYRVKVKGEAYKATHRLINGLTERRAADLWYAGKSLPSSLPDETKAWFADQCSALDTAVAELDQAITDVWDLVAHIGDRKVFVQTVGPKSREFRGCLSRLTGRSHDLRLQVYTERFNGGRPRSVDFAGGEQ